MGNDTQFEHAVHWALWHRSQWGSKE